MTNTRKPTGLIRRERLIPKNPEDLSEVKANNKSSNKDEDQSKFENQKANIKISNKTKTEIDVLMNLTKRKFTYEMVESMIDSYVRNELSPDEQRVFKALTNLM